ncbi:MAG: RNA polymerase sigma factor [Pirellulales bacterium]
MNVLALDHARSAAGLALMRAGLAAFMADLRSRSGRMATRPSERTAFAASLATEKTLDVVDPQDWQDIRATLTGDGRAYARLVDRYQGEIAGQMWRFTRQRGVYEELVHDVFVEAYLSLPQFHGRSPLVHWLRKIATRVGYRYWKERARDRARGTLPIEDWDGAREGDSDESRREAGELVHTVLSQLPPRDRLILTLVYLEGCSVAEAAELAGWSQTMAKVQAYRARKKLQKLLEELNR